ncbi:MAG: helix-turn-helix transcriptional regulator [bacterium]|nr:helix-turn-helix transcriptional regulator [bacterium]
MTSRKRPASRLESTCRLSWCRKRPERERWFTFSRAAPLNEAAFRYYPRLARVREFVLSSYSEQLTLADAARVARMERTAFSDFFHRKTGVRFRDWLAGVRVTKAQELLAERDFPVTKVARKVGYGSVRSFERVFLRTTGVTAVAYKKTKRPS